MEYLQGTSTPLVHARAGRTQGKCTSLLFRYAS